MKGEKRNIYLYSNIIFKPLPHLSRSKLNFSAQDTSCTMGRINNSEKIILL